MQFQTLLFALLPALALAAETAPVPTATGVSPTGGAGAPSNGTKPTAGSPKPTNDASEGDGDGESGAMSLAGNAAGAFVVAIGAMAAGAMI